MAENSKINRHHSVRRQPLLAQWIVTKTVNLKNDFPGNILSKFFSEILINLNFLQTSREKILLIAWCSQKLLRDQVDISSQKTFFWRLFSDSKRKFFVCCCTPLYLPTGTFWWKNAWNKLKSYIFGLQAENFGKVVKTAFYMCRESIFENNFKKTYKFKNFLGHWTANFRKLDNKKRQSCHNCILRVQRNLGFWKVFKLTRNWQTSAEKSVHTGGIYIFLLMYIRMELTKEPGSTQLPNTSRPKRTCWKKQKHCLFEIRKTQFI